MTMHWLNVFSVVLLTCLTVRADGDSDSVSRTLQVRLTSGNFVGETSVVNGTDRWLGIPFAQPPLGPLRFKAPVAITNAPQGVQSATQFGDACPKLPSATLFARAQSEDCLTLNVWRPIVTSASDKLPVLVWFYVRITTFRL